MDNQEFGFDRCRISIRHRNGNVTKAVRYMNLEFRKEINTGLI